MHYLETKKRIRTGKRTKVWSCLVIFICLLMAMPQGTAGQAAGIQDILITMQQDKILVFGRLTNCFTKDMESAIMAGVPTTFTFYLNLSQQRSLWLDKKVAAVEVRHDLKYDSVKKTFYVTSSQRKDVASFPDLESAKRAMAEFNGTIPLPAKGLQKESPHYLMMKAKLDKVRLPLYMEYVFFFVSLWDFETTWYRQAITF